MWGKEQMQKGWLTASWFSQTAQTIDPETVLFSLHFRALAATELSEVLQINSGLTPAEAYTRITTSEVLT